MDWDGLIFVAGYVVFSIGVGILFAYMIIP